MNYRLLLSLLLSFVVSGHLQACALGEIAGGSSSGSSSGGSGGGSSMPSNGAMGKPSGSSALPIKSFRQQKVLSLMPNDVVMFAGDSVTWLGDNPGGWVDIIRTYLRSFNSARRIGIGAAGVPGDTAYMLYRRFDSTVLNYNPSVVVIFIGINDVGGMSLNPDGSTNLYEYMGYIDGMVRKALGHRGVRTVALMTPMGRGDKMNGENQWDARVDEMAQALRNYAASHNLPLIDVRQTIVDGERLYNSDNRSYGVFFDQSMVHPSPLGNQVVAGTVLLGFGE